jgi:hypothetical protein
VRCLLDGWILRRLRDLLLSRDSGQSFGDEVAACTERPADRRLRSGPGASARRGAGREDVVSILVVGPSLWPSGSWTARPSPRGRIGKGVAGEVAGVLKLTHRPDFFLTRRNAPANLNRVAWTGATLVLVNTRIDTHVVNQRGRGARSPVDRLGPESPRSALVADFAPGERRNAIPPIPETWIGGSDRKPGSPFGFDRFAPTRGS